jgi:DNA-binding NarL/FixJ family response regulator
MEGEPMRVLIVDDSDEYRRYLRWILAEQEDLILEAEAADGEAGILLAQQLKPDVIFMDIHLPGMHGLEATRRIKENQALAVIIILSNDEAYRDAAETCGADAFLSKCSSISEILAVIRRVQPKAGCLVGCA